MGELFTIGHTHHKTEYFLSLLNKYQIKYLLDVRSVPYSKYAEQFNREYLHKVISNAGIQYVYMGKYFGARQDNENLYCANGYLDFEKVRESTEFNKRVDNVILGLSKGNNIVLMCTEKEPIDCHRAIMVARAFETKGIPVKHILPDGGIFTQKQLNEQLLEKYFPHRAQLSLFADDMTSDTEYLVEAYRLRNKDIGYRLHSLYENGMEEG